MKFIDSSHIYVNEKGERYRSVTNLLHSLESYKDWDAIAKKYAKKHGMTLEAVQAAWQHEKDISIVRGKNIHALEENFYLNNQSCVVFSEEHGRPMAIFGNPVIDDVKEKKTLKLEEGIYPELMVWLDSVKLAGQGDYIEVVDNVINIDDYKGLDINTPIATKKGWKTMGTIKKGDIVFDGNGDQTEVEFVSDIHYNPCYKIKFDTNDVIIADHEHRWVVNYINNSNKTFEKEMTTEDLYKYYYKRKEKKSKILKIKCTSINTEYKKLPIDPYVLGLWLADGNRTCGTITSVNQNIWDEIKKRGYNISDDHNINNNTAESRTIYGIRKHLTNLNVLKNKHIPDIYMRASYEQRLDLLRGFSDGDGHFNKIRKRCVFSTTKTWQVNALNMLISSLGFKPTTIPYKGSGFGRTNIQMYSVCFTPKINPFLCRNFDFLDNMKNVNFNKSLFRSIISIEKTDTIPTKCIAVKSKDKTYLAGYNLIKTHNTNKKIDVKSFVRWDGTSDKLKYPCNHLDDCNFNIYSLQLNMYAYIIKRNNPKLKIGRLRIIHFLFNEDGTVKDKVYYIVPDLQKEIKTIINLLKANKI